MTLRKVFILISVPLMMHGIYACICNPPYVISELESIEIETLSGIEIINDSLFHDDMAQDTISATYDSVALKINHITVESSLGLKRTMQGITSAYACDVGYEAVDLLKTIEVISNSDFNIDFPAGSDLRNILKLSLMYTYDNFILSTLHNGSIDVYMNSFESILIQFIQATNAAQTHTFTITYTIEDGSTFTTTTDPITIIP